jgi:hypothetical protein
MAKVYLSPAYHYFNRCAVAGCDETTHNNLYLDQLTPYLDACGIQWKRGPRRTPKSGEDGNTSPKFVCTIASVAWISVRITS